MDFEDRIILALFNDMNTPREIAKRLNMSKEFVKKTLDKLELEGFVKKRIVGTLFKKEVYELTEKGYDRALKLKGKLEDIAREFKRAYESDDRERLESLYREYRSLIPLMILMNMFELAWLGLIFSDLYDFDFYEESYEDMDFDFDDIGF